PGAPAGGLTAMNLSARRLLHLAGGAAALPAVSRLAWAQAYPAQPVRIIVGFGPGGVSDILARLIGQWLSERFGRPFIIDNRPGAGTNIELPPKQSRGLQPTAIRSSGSRRRTRSTRHSTPSSISISTATF